MFGQSRRYTSNFDFVQNQAILKVTHGSSFLTSVTEGKVFVCSLAISATFAMPEHRLKLLSETRE